jgi:hypothetical protein
MICPKCHAVNLNSYLICCRCRRPLLGATTAINSSYAGDNNVVVTNILNVVNGGDGDSKLSSCDNYCSGSYDSGSSSSSCGCD